MLVSVIPVFDAKMAVHAYCLDVKKANNLVLDANTSKYMDGIMNSMSLNVINSVGLEALTSNAPVFVRVNPILLLTDLSSQCNADHDKIIFVLDSSLEPQPMYTEKMQELINEGFSFAIEGIKNYDYYAPILSLCSYIFLNSKTTDLKAAKLFLGNNFRNLKLIASRISTAEQFNEVKFGKYDMYEGKFYRLPLSKGSYAVSPLKVNYIQLLNIVNDENFELNEVADVVQQDTALAISLLKMVNKLGFASEIKSINHAAAMLGQEELRRWITTAVADKLYADKPNEITRLSLLRAKFAEGLAPCFEMAILAKEMYLMGLFSVLDIILEMPIAEALTLVKVSSNIREALVEGKGKYIPVLNFIKAYESADWQEVSRLVIIHNISEDKLYKVFVDSVLWYGRLIRAD